MHCAPILYRPHQKRKHKCLGDLARAKRNTHHNTFLYALICNACSKVSQHSKSITTTIHANNLLQDDRISRQRSGGGQNDVALDIGSIAAAGERCIDKVVMVQETEYDDEITCKHSYTNR